MSEEIPMFCPECGAMLDDKPICDRCGYNTSTGGFVGDQTSEGRSDLEQDDALFMEDGVSKKTKKSDLKQKKKFNRAKSKSGKITESKSKKNGDNGDKDIAALEEIIKEKIAPYLWIINILFALFAWIYALLETIGMVNLLSINLITSRPSIIYHTITWATFGLVLSILLSLMYIKPILAKQIQNGLWEEILFDYSKFGKFQIPQILFWSIIQSLILGFWGGIPLLLVALFICMPSNNRKKIKWITEPIIE